MKNQFLSLFIGSLLFFACQEKKPATDSFTTQVDQLAHRYLALERFSGAILIAEGPKILFNQTYGFADYTKKQPFTTKTTFKIGELTKLFTGYIIEQMAKEGKLNLIAPVKTYLPYFEGNHTIQDLLDKKNNPDKIGYHVLGQLIEKQLGKTYQQAIEQYFPPLGIQETYFQQAEKNLAKGYLFHNYRGQGMELEIASNYEENTAFSSFGLKSTTHDLWKLSEVLNGQNIYESGYLKEDGFSYTFQKDTITNLTIIILSNRRHPISEEIANSIKVIYQELPYELPLLRKPVANNVQLYPDYVGTYQVNSNVTFEVIQKKDSLFSLMGGQETHLIPQSDMQFYYRDFDAAIRFVRDSHQVFSQAILYNGFLEGQKIPKKTEK